MATLQQHNKKNKTAGDSTKPTDADDALIAYLLHLGDNALVLGHRNSEWTGQGPILEQDIAISNIALDLIGQARNFYQYAAVLINASKSATFPGPKQNTEVTEDTIAYFRDAIDFRNCLLVEQSNGDWARTILRQFFFSSYQFYLYEQLQFSKDETIAAISEKAYKEVGYHLKWSSEWVIRLGDGTAESKRRLLLALDELWKFTDELFIPADYEQELANRQIAAPVQLIKPKWQEKLNEIFEEATLSENRPATGWMGFCGKKGIHGEELGYILAELQFLQRAYPGCEW